LVDWGRGEGCMSLRLISERGNGGETSRGRTKDAREDITRAPKTLTIKGGTSVQWGRERAWEKKTKKE